MTGSGSGFVLVHLLIILLYAIIAYAIGRRLLAGFNFNSGWEALCFSLGIGISVTIIVVMFLGFVHLLYSWAILSVFGILAVYSYPVYSRWPAILVKYFNDRGTSRRDFIYFIISISILSIILIPVLKIPFYPPTGYDATAYHLAYAKHFANWHAIELTPYLRFPVFTNNIEMLYTMMLTVFDDICAQLMHFLCLITVVIAIIAWAKRIQSIQSGFWAGAIMLTSPQAFMLAGTGYITFGLTLVTTLGIYAFLNWIHEHDEKWLWLSGIFMGIAVGSNYSSLFIALIIGVCALYFDLRSRRLRSVIIFGATVIAVGCPWFIRNAIYTGNPFFPFMTQLFTNRFWSEADIKGILEEMGSHGTGKSLTSLIQMPWNLVYHYGLFVEPNPPGKIWFWMLPIALIMGNLRPYTRWLLAFAGLYFLFWFVSAQQIRYLEPILPVIVLTASVGFDTLLKKIPFGELAHHWLITAALILALMIPGLNYGWMQIRYLGPVPSNTEARVEFLNRMYPTYRFYNALNQEFGQNYKVYSINDIEMQYYCDGTMMGDWFGPARFSECMRFGPGVRHEFLDSETVYRKLRTELGADYLIYNRGDLQPPIPNDEFFLTHFKVAGLIKPSESASPIAVMFKIVD